MIVWFERGRYNAGTFYPMNEAVTILESSQSLEIDLNELENGKDLVVVPDNSNIISDEAYSTTVEWTLIDSNRLCAITK